jgi:hypothetical protein
MAAFSLRQPVKQDVLGASWPASAPARIPETVTESSPEAWQEIDGRLVQVRVAFAALSGGAIGFKLGSYDPRYPLTIDPAF